MTNPPGNPDDPNGQPDPFAQTQFGQTPNFDKDPQAPQQPQAPQYGQQPPQYGQQPSQGQPYGAYGQHNAGYGAGGAQPEWTPGANGSVAPGAGAPQGFTPQANTGYVDIVGVGRMQVADIGKRFLARLIDGVLYGAVYLVCFLIGGASLSTADTQCSTNSLTGAYECNTDGGGFAVGAFFGMMALALAFGLLYEWLMIAFKGATLGKMAMKIKVVDQLSGQPIGLGRAFVRQIIPFVGAFICYVGAIVVYLSPLFDNSGRMQGWHDKAANDLVVIAG